MDGASGSGESSTPQRRRETPWKRNGHRKRNVEGLDVQFMFVGVCILKHSFFESMWFHGSFSKSPNLEASGPL